MSDQSWIVIANWKMNKTIKEASTFVETLLPKIAQLKNPLWITAPYTLIDSLHRLQDTYRFVLGAQNMNDASAGAFTGEIAASMLKEVGATFVLLGHSERRHIFHETDEFIARKVVRALESALLPVLCIGETFEERQTGETNAVLARQLSCVLEACRSAHLQELLVAYEPVWAIGTGLTATNDDIIQAVTAIEEVASHFQVKVKVLYGGSVNSKNAEELALVRSLAGFLVGGASLETDSFAKIALLSENKRLQLS